MPAQGMGSGVVFPMLGKELTEFLVELGVTLTTVPVAKANERKGTNDLSTNQP